MAPPEDDHVDAVVLRFVGQDREGHDDVHELRAAHVAEVLEGLVGLHGDFDRAGAFGEGPPSEIVVRPPREGSFIIEVVRLAMDNPVAVAGVLGVPSLGAVVRWATKSLRADVEDFDYLDNGNVKVKWQDHTVDEVPEAAWEELKKRKRRRKKQLRQIMAPLSDEHVTALKVSGDDDTLREEDEDAPPSEFTLDRKDYDLARPEDEIEETYRTFETEAQMAAIDFDSPERWRVKTSQESRTATVEDRDFLGRLDRGLALRKNDVFNLRIREDEVTTNGRTRRTWKVLEVVGHRRRYVDGDDA